MTTMGRWALAAAAVAALAAGREASASCAQRRSLQTFENQKPPYVYAYILPGSDGDSTAAAVKGRFWAMGDRASANEGTYSDDTWIDPSANGLNINARLDAPGVVGCPAAGASMIAVIETTTLDKSSARFVALTALETPLLPVRWDFSRVNRSYTMLDIPTPQILGNATFDAATQKWTVNVSISAVTSALFGPVASTAMSGYQMEAVAGSADPGRDPAVWTPTTLVPSFGALVTSTPVEVPCPPGGGGNAMLAIRPLFESGVPSDWVGKAATVTCPALP